MESMTPEEVTRRNEAIALFMGWELIGDYWDMDPEDENPDCNSTISRDSLDFHLHWWCMMPVLERILSNPHSGFEIDGNQEESQRKGVFHCFLHAVSWSNTSSGDSASMIEAVWMAVSEWVLSRATPEKQDGRGKQDKA